MVVSFIGTTSGMTIEQTEKFIEETRKINNKEKIKEFHHNLKQGATISAHLSICRLGLTEEIIIHLCNNKNNINEYIEEQWKQYINFRKINYNTQKESDEDLIKCCDILIAIPSNYEEESFTTTWNLIKKAKKINKDLVIILPKGEVINWPDISMIPKFIKNRQKRK